MPGAFKLKYNTDGEKVVGRYWKSGLIELGKSAVKCVSYLAVPAAIVGMASGAGVVAAGLLGAAAFGSSFVLSSLFEEVLPEEQKLVAEACKKKGISAHIYAEIVGYGQSADAYDMVAPDPEGNGAIKSMELALADAGLKPEDIDYINPHGTSTGLGDVAESQAIAKIFGDKDQNKNLVVSSSKSMHGLMLRAETLCRTLINSSVVVLPSII